MKQCRCRWLSVTIVSSVRLAGSFFLRRIHSRLLVCCYWLTFCPSECSICMENNDWWTLGVVSMVCSQSLVLSYLGNLTWPALRMGSELFLGVVMVRLAAAFENWPRLIKLHDSSSLWVETQSLLLAEGCTVGSGGSQQLRRALLWGLRFKTRSRFFSLALDVKFGSHTFLRGLFFISSPQQLEKRECLWSQIQKTSL